MRNKIESDPYFRQLCALRNPAPKTRQGYLYGLSIYCSWTGKAPSELIEDAEEDIKQGKLMKEREVFYLLPEFGQHLGSLARNGRPLTPRTKQVIYSTIRTFYTTFYIDVPKTGYDKAARPTMENTRTPDKDMIRTALNMAPLQLRAIMMIGLSSGLAVSDICNLTVKQFREGYDPKTEVCTLHLTRRKTGVEFYTFLSPECCRIVHQYIKWRNRPPVDNTPGRVAEYTARKIQEDSYLIIPSKIREKTRTHRPQLTVGTVAYSFRRLNDTTCKQYPPGQWREVRSHNMRKYFNTTLKNNGMDGDLIEYMMGHTLSGSKEAYFKADPDKLKELYIQFVPYLTIQKEVDVAESAEYQQIKKENKVLQAETARHIVERSDMSEMQKQIEAMQKQQDATNILMQALSNDPEIMNRIAQLKK